MRSYADRGHLEAGDGDDALRPAGVGPVVGAVVAPHGGGDESDGDHVGVLLEDLHLLAAGHRQLAGGRAGEVGDHPGIFTALKKKMRICQENLYIFGRKSPSR